MAAAEVLDPDAVLMAAVAQGDERALRALIEKWQRPLIAYLYRSCGSLSDAEELAQTTFVRLYRAAPRYEPKAKFSTYLFCIARKLLMNHARTRRRKPAQSMAPEVLAQMDLSVEDERNLAEWEDVFTLALEGLSEKERTALLLLKQQGLAYEEIAETMGASTGAVKTWIFRARERVRDFLKKEASPKGKEGV